MTAVAIEHEFSHWQDVCALEVILPWTGVCALIGGRQVAIVRTAVAVYAIGPDGATVSELGRRLGVTKQAAAKTTAGLAELGYIARQPSTLDARATVLTRTARGEEMLDLSGRSRAGRRCRSPSTPSPGCSSP